MSKAPVVIVDADENRRRTLSLLIRASTRVQVESFPAVSVAYPGFCEANTRILHDETRLFLCPWDEGGEAMVLERIVLGGSGPALVILSDTVSASRIALCHRAGNTHLIPTTPLNLNALRTRILLSIEGPATLAERVCRSGTAMRAAFASFPALRRRLAV